MKRIQRFWLWLVLAAGTVGLVASVPVASAVVIHLGVGVAAPAPPPVVYHYTYYPDAEVYFDPVARLYWWNSGGVWVSGPSVPAGITLGGSVNLDVDGREPWHHHDVIRRHYPRHHHDHD
ncbi:MAG TPA: hypothetical protein VMP11_17015 [Verrucomicrobiae bacterium]|nr:hypothetical protein [Verrucomicrobiae bacterium]